MSTDTKLVSMRLRASTREKLEGLSNRWQVSQADVVMLAIEHLAGTTRSRDAEASHAIHALKRDFEKMQKTVDDFEKTLFRDEGLSEFYKIVDQASQMPGGLVQIFGLRPSRKNTPSASENDDANDLLAD